MGVKSALDSCVKGDVIAQSAESIHSTPSTLIRVYNLASAFVITSVRQAAFSIDSGQVAAPSGHGLTLMLHKQQCESVGKP